ncbi:Gfo/Idh/MocA family protein [Seohaeicola zhoushanensis]
MIVRWGILGAANFARQHMGPAIHAAKGADLVALATGSADKAEGFRAFCPGLRVHPTYDALLTDREIDAVYVPLPNHMHVDWTLKALDAGKHVLCEKPMTMQAAEFHTLMARRDQTGLLAAEAFMIVHHPQWQWVKEQVAGGYRQPRACLGAVQLRQPRPRQYPQPVRHRRRALRDIGVYVFGSTRFVTGEEPVEVASRIRWESGVDTFSEITASFPGFTYSAYVSTRLHPAQEMVFHGEAGLIRLATPFNANVFGMAQAELHRPGLEVMVKRWPGENHYVRQVEAFGHSIRTGEAYPCPLEFSYGTQEMIDRAFDEAVTL